MGIFSRIFQRGEMEPGAESDETAAESDEPGAQSDVTGAGTDRTAAGANGSTSSSPTEAPRRSRQNPAPAPSQESPPQASSQASAKSSSHLAQASTSSTPKPTAASPSEPNRTRVEQYKLPRGVTLSGPTRRKEPAAAGAGTATAAAAPGAAATAPSQTPRARSKPPAPLRPPDNGVAAPRAGRPAGPASPQPQPRPQPSARTSSKPATSAAPRPATERGAPRGRTAPRPATRERTAPNPRKEPQRASAAASAPAGKPRRPSGRAVPDTGEIEALVGGIGEPGSPAQAGAGAAAASSSDRGDESDRAAVGELFEELAVHYMAQLRDLMIEVRWGHALTEWIAEAEPVVRSLRGMAEQVERKPLLEPLDRLMGELKRAQSSGAVVEGAEREALLAAYAPLVDIMPKAFELDAERDRREPIIVRALLLQIPGVEKLTLDKLQAAGVLTVEALATAAPEELAQAAGVQPELAVQIAARFSDYRNEAGAAMAAPRPAVEHRRLAALLRNLRETHRAFEEAAAKWSREARARKRRMRRERAEALLRVHVSLARLGQIDRLVKLDKLPFHKKIEEIDTYLSAARAKRSPPPQSPIQEGRRHG